VNPFPSRRHWARGLLAAALAWCCVAPAWALPPPTVAQWVDLMQEVRRHPLFHGLVLKYARAPAAQVHTPVAVAELAGLDCEVVIAEGENPKMDRIMTLTGDSAPEVTRVFLMTMAAHELGHCFRIRNRHLTAAMWEQVYAAREGSPERTALEQALSIEEAYADAYALAYLQDAHPEVYAPVLAAMHVLRDDPYFANRFYQLAPLYEQVDHGGLDASLPLPQRVEALMHHARFPALAPVAAVGQ
jgi:hypothetical protein